MIKYVLFTEDVVTLCVWQMALIVRRSRHVHTFNTFTCNRNSMYLGYIHQDIPDTYKLPSVTDIPLKFEFDFPPLLKKVSAIKTSNPTTSWMSLRSCLSYRVEILLLVERISLSYNSQKVNPDIWIDQTTTGYDTNKCSSFSCKS